MHTSDKLTQEHKETETSVKIFPAALFGIPKNWKLFIKEQIKYCDISTCWNIIQQSSGMNHI